MFINPGKFKHLITVQRKEIIEDNVGNQLVNWIDIKRVYADINGLYGSEYWEAAAKGQQDTIVFTVRWSKTLEDTMRDITDKRISYKGNSYEILNFDNVKFENRLCKIKAVNK